MTPQKWAELKTWLEEYFDTGYPADAKMLEIILCKMRQLEQEYD